MDPPAGTVRVSRTLAAVKGAPTFQEPKTPDSARVVPLTGPAQAALRAHRARQAEERLASGAAWQHHDLVFCTSGGTPMHPSGTERPWYALRARAGVPEARVPCPAAHGGHPHALGWRPPGGGVRGAGPLGLLLAEAGLGAVPPGRQTGRCRAFGCVLGGRPGGGGEGRAVIRSATEMTTFGWALGAKWRSGATSGVSGVGFLNPVPGFESSRAHHANRGSGRRTGGRSLLPSAGTGRGGRRGCGVGAVERLGPRLHGVGDRRRP